MWTLVDRGGGRPSGRRQRTRTPGQAVGLRPDPRLSRGPPRPHREVAPSRRARVRRELHQGSAIPPPNTSNTFRGGSAREISVGPPSRPPGHSNIDVEEDSPHAAVAATCRRDGEMHWVARPVAKHCLLRLTELEGAVAPTAQTGE